MEKHNREFISSLFYCGKNYTIVIEIILFIMREKCPKTEYFLVRIFLYSDGIQENTDQKILCIWTLFTQCYLQCPYSIKSKLGTTLGGSIYTEGSFGL